jgi:hypothetical protein
MAAFLAPLAMAGLKKLIANKTFQALGSAGLQAGLGALMQGKNARQARAGEAELEASARQSPVYSGSKELEGFYDESMRRSQQNLFQSGAYLAGQEAIGRSNASLLAAMTNRGGANAMANRIDTSTKSAQNRLVEQFDQKRRQDFSILGQASRLLAQDKLTKFDINEATPFNRQFGLKQMKVQAANSRANAGQQTWANALSNATAIGISSLNNQDNTGSNTGLGAQDGGTVAPRTTGMGTYEATYPPNTEFSPTMPKPLFGVNPKNMKGLQTLLPKTKYSNLKMKGVTKSW